MTNEIDRVEQAKRDLLLNAANSLENFARLGLTADRATNASIAHAVLLLRSLELHMASGAARTRPFRYEGAFDREGRVESVQNGTVWSTLFDPADPNAPESCEFPLDLVPQAEREHFAPGTLFRMTVGTAVHYLRKTSRQDGNDILGIVHNLLHAVRCQALCQGTPAEAEHQADRTRHWNELVQKVRDGGKEPTQRDETGAGGVR